MNIAPCDKNENNNDNTISDIESPDSFIASFMDVYNKNLQFNHSLLVGLLNSNVAKISGMGDPRCAHNLVNF